jgi:aldehyde dehydrogenase (NAD+)
MTDLLNRDRLFIGGDWVPPATTDTIDVISSSTEEVIARVVEAGPVDVDRAVAAARAAFDAGPWPTMSPAERADVLNRLIAAIGERTDQFADAIASEVGSPRKWAKFGQVAIATAVLNVYANLAGTYGWTDERTGAMGNPVNVRRLPVGVVGAIVPWNAPLFTAALKLGPALIAGCTVVLKPAPEAALDAFLLADAVEAAGFPAGVLNIVPAGRPGSERLVAHADVDKISFTGSTAVGRQIGAICGADLRRCTLELGGKSAAILLDDVVLDDKTVGELVTAGMANNGQVCAAQTRILAPRARYAEVCDALGSAVGAMQIGDASDPATTIGPLATARQRDRVEHYLRAGVHEGARAIVGGGRPRGLDRGWFVEPTVFVDATNDMSIAREEIFGPVLTVIPYDGDDDAVAIANDSDYGLTGTVWTTDLERGEALANRVRAGVMAFNTAAAMDLMAPFGGFKQSGIGRECGPEAFEAYTELQSVVLPKR